MESLTRNELEQFYADALAINATIRSENERLKRQVNDQAQRIDQLQSLGIAAAEGMIATANEGIELSKKYEELETQRDALAAELEVLSAFRDEVVGVMNESGFIHVVGRGLFVPAQSHVDVKAELAQAQAERDALAAQNNMMRQEMQSVADRLSVYWNELKDCQREEIERLLRASKLPPLQSLAEIRAEAGLAGLKHGVMLASEMNVKPDSVLLQCWCDGYAAKVRQGTNQ